MNQQVQTIYPLEQVPETARYFLLMDGGVSFFDNEKEMEAYANSCVDQFREGNAINEDVYDVVGGRITHRFDDAFIDTSHGGETTRKNMVVFACDKGFQRWLTSERNKVMLAVFKTLFHQYSPEKENTQYKSLLNSIEKFIKQEATK